MPVDACRFPHEGNVNGGSLLGWGGAVGAGVGGLDGTGEEGILGRRERRRIERKRERGREQNKGQEPTIPNRHPRLPPHDAQRVHRVGRGPELVEVADVGPGDGVDGLVSPGHAGGLESALFSLIFLVHAVTRSSFVEAVWELGPPLLVLLHHSLHPHHRRTHATPSQHKRHEKQKGKKKRE